MKEGSLPPRRIPRHALTDQQWENIRPLLPQLSKFAPRATTDLRLVFHAIRWILKTGAAWRDLDSWFPAWQTIYGVFNRFRKQQVFLKVYKILLQDLNNKGKIDNSQWNIDGTSIRAQRCAAGANSALGRSKGGFGSKLHLITDGVGTVLNLEITKGQAHEAPLTFDVLNGVDLKTEGWTRQKPYRLAGDKGYDSKDIRRRLRQRGIEPVIAPKKTRRKETRGRKKKFNKEDYKRRHVVENTIGHYKENRRLATRYEKHAESFKSLFYVACIAKAAEI